MTATLFGCRGEPPAAGEVDQIVAPLSAADNTDIGAVGATGSYAQNGGTYTLEGAGADIWTTADAFRFAWEDLAGDGTITARVASLENTNGFAKAGVMIRENLTAGAKNAFALLTPTTANGWRFQTRTATDGTTAKTNVGTAAPPNWVRLQRAGNTFTASYSTNGTSWTQLGAPVSITMAASVKIGLAVTSHVAGTLATVSFTNVTITRPAPPTPPPAPTNLTATAGNGQVGLTWNPSTGATSYTVKRATVAGGPHAVVQAGLTATSFTNTGLVNGTPYFFVVTASNAGGDSGDSNEATATPALPPPPPAPANLVATAGNAQVGLTWSGSAGATSYAVKRATIAGGPYTLVQGGITMTSFTNTGLSNGTTYHFVVSATGPGGEGLDSGQASATPVAPPPAPVFSSQDIGAVGAAGNSSISSGTHTIRGAGNDIYGTADAFRFVYQNVTGDVTITARVQSLTATNVWAKAGVMIREDLTAGARNVFALTSPTATNKYRHQVRGAVNGGSTSTASVANSALPSWVRLERAGNTFRSFHSSNGTAWTLISTTTLALNASTRVGLAVTSHVSGTLTTAIITDVTVAVPLPPAAPTGLAATPGNNQVHLTWAPTPGASSYSVKRADSDAGPYTTVASGLVEPSYTNTGLVNGNTYYFVVAAHNPAGSSPDSDDVAGTPLLLRPSVRTVAPADGATSVATSAFVSLDLIMPNVGGGVDASTLDSSTVFLRKASDSSLVAATVNTSGGGDVVVLQPLVQLEPQTLYNFALTDGLRDLTGAPFVPFASSFTTGDPPPPPPPDVTFEKLVAATSVDKIFSSVTVGPDGKLYAVTLTGEIYRWTIDANTGALSGQTVINTIKTANGADRAVIGVAFDPAATAGNLILWVTHGGSALKEAPDWTGKLSKLTGASLSTYQDVVINFPRSYKDHMTNSIAFKAGEPNNIYINQGSMNAMGAPDNAWGQRAEHLLAAAVLKLDTTKLGALPLNVQTNDADPITSGYNPFAANAPLTIFATGVRNAYDLVWHSNGSLYVPTNGSAAGGNTPPTPVAVAVGLHPPHRRHALHQPDRPRRHRQPGGRGRLPVSRGAGRILRPPQPLSLRVGVERRQPDLGREPR